MSGIQILYHVEDSGEIVVLRHCESVEEALRIQEDIQSLHGSRIERDEFFIYCRTGCLRLAELQEELGPNYALEEA